MLESARYQAVLDLITEIFIDETPADKIINEYMRARKYIGSKDRRFISDKTWEIIRNRMKLEFDIQSFEPRDVLIAYLKDELEVFGGEGYGLSSLTALEKEKISKINQENPYPKSVEFETPEWLYNKVRNDVLLKAMQSTATADFRSNVKNLDLLIDNLKMEGFAVYKTPYSQVGFRSDDRLNLNNCLAYNDGNFDVQDEGSQIISILCDVKKEEKAIDYCAGGGGKALTISYLLNNQGNIDAHDIDWHRLEQIKPRIERLQASGINIIREVKDKDYDKFIIDAPCSGSGTWRRSPDAKYRLTRKKLDELNKIQKDLLEIGYNHTKIGGKIIYITCSILQDENENIINKLLETNKNLKLVDMKSIWDKKFEQPYPHKNNEILKLSPVLSNTDAYFMVILEKTN